MVASQASKKSKGSLQESCACAGRAQAKWETGSPGGGTMGQKWHLAMVRAGNPISQGLWAALHCPRLPLLCLNPEYKARKGWWGGGATTVNDGVGDGAVLPGLHLQSWVLGTKSIPCNTVCCVSGSPLLP